MSLPADPPYRRSLPSTAEAIAEACDWLRELASRHGLDEEKGFLLELCAGELLANISEYAYGAGVGDIQLELWLAPGSASLALIDAGQPFDLLGQPAFSTPGSLEALLEGGLGLHLVRQFADSLFYQRQDGRNRTTVRIGGQPRVARQKDRRSGQGGGPPWVRSDGTRVEQDQRSGRDRRALGFISRIALFRDVPYRDVENILARCKLRQAEPGEILFHAGRHHHCVLVVIDGKLEVRLDSPESRSAIEIGPGECVGELSVADGKPNSAWVVASEASRLLEIPEAVFLGPVLGIAAIARNLIVVLSERMRRSNDQIVARLRAALELEALQRELDLARQIQSSMLPAAPLFPGCDGIAGRGFMRAARHVGGDFYDAFPLGDGRLFLAIGDVCNKGTPAALFMVRTLTLLRSEALRLEADAGQHLARLAVRCNDLLSQSNDAQQFVTLFCAIVDLAQGCLHFVNVGHNPPLLCLPGAEPLFMPGPRNPLAGLFSGLAYTAGRHDFPAGSLLLLYTDGVTEAESADGGQFGDEALQRLLRGENEADTCVERIIAAVDAFAAGHPQSDDITLLAIQRLG
jgi:serine phosphatase RsbU (regulator of sigma subunit)/anti-sigma regulatory factor (Ser/Thr protein kinase)